MMEQVRLCAVWLMEICHLPWLFLEPDTRLDHCPRILLSFFRARISVDRGQNIMIINEPQLLGHLKLHPTSQPLHVFGHHKFEHRCLIFHLNSPLVPMFEMGVRQFRYRVTHLLANLGWVDLDFDSSTVCSILHGLVGIWQKRLSSWARWWNIPNQSQPNPGSPGDGSPCIPH